MNRTEAHSKMRGLILSLIFAITFSHGPLPFAYGADRPVFVSLAISDTEILVCDAVAYKVVVENKTLSEVQLRNVKTQRKVHVIQYLECRSPEKEWVTVREVSAAKEGAYRGDLRIAGKESFAFYGQFFLDEKRDFVFTEPGDYEVRIRLSCLLGEFVTDSRRITAKDRPAKEVACLKDSRRLLERILSPLKEDPFLEEMIPIQKALAAGATKKTLDLLVLSSLYRKTGKVHDKELSLLPAYEAVCANLDEIRRDTANDEFLVIAHERKAWPELAKLLSQSRADSDSRRTYAHELETAIQMGLYQSEKP